MKGDFCMTTLSEQISELSAELLLRAAGELSQIAYNAASFVRDVGGDAGAVARAQLVKLINAIGSEKNTKEQNKAIKKLEEAAMKDGETPRQVTILEQDREAMEKWLKKQDVLYVALRSGNQSADGPEKCMITFLEKDAEAVNIAVALTQHEKGYINELPPMAMLLLHKKKDLSVIDNLNVYELEVFREVAKDFGLVYSSMLNPPDNETDLDSYKVLASKKDVNKLAAVMQRVAWSMTGEYQNGIKEKVKERYSIKSEIQKIISQGIGPNQVFMIGKDNSSVAIENAKYIVNSKSPNQYIKVTNEGFVHYKFGKEIDKVSRDDKEYEVKLQFALGEFVGAVVFDAAEWEQEGLEKANLRKAKVKQKLSVFPPEHNKEEETRELRKAHKRHKEHESLPETAWLFDKYDTEKAFSEVVEVNYNDYSKPPEETVSVHYNDAVKHSEKYKYYDVVNDEKTIDNIILSAKERSLGNDEYEQVVEKEVTM